MFRIPIFAALALVATYPACAAGPQAASTSAPAVPAATLLTYAGTYANERGIEATVELSLDGGLTISINSPALAMRPLSQTEFAVDAKQAKVTFDIAAGKVAGLKVSMKGREVYFSRVK